jgi:hypothetical protein
MATIKAFSIPGMKLWFYSNDHEPPHFHAKRKGQWEVRVRFLERGEALFEMKWRKSSKTVPSARDRKRLGDMVEKHRFELLRQWEEVQSS